MLLAAVGLWAAELALNALGVGAGDWAFVANALYYLPFMLLPAAAYMARRHGLSDSVRLNPLSLRGALAAAALALLSVYAASGLASAWQLLLEALGLRAVETAFQPDSVRALMLAVVTMAAVPAVCEELLFRGLAFAAWESRGTWLAVGATSALFALLHGNLFGLPAYLLVGGVSGFMVFALNSLYAGIIYHTVYNAACLVIPWMLADRSVPEAPIDGGMIAAMAFETLAVLAMMAVLLAALRLRARARGIMPVPRDRRPLAAKERIMLLAAVLAMLANNVIIAALAAGTGGGA